MPRELNLTTLTTVVVGQFGCAARIRDMRLENKKYESVLPNLKTEVQRLEEVKARPTPSKKVIAHRPHQT